MAKFVHSGHKVVGIALKEYKDLPLQVKAGKTKAIYYFYNEQKAISIIIRDFSFTLLSHDFPSRMLYSWIAQLHTSSYCHTLLSIFIDAEFYIAHLLLPHSQR